MIMFIVNAAKGFFLQVFCYLFSQVSAESTSFKFFVSHGLIYFCCCLIMNLNRCFFLKNFYGEIDMRLFWFRYRNVS